jgi:nucleotide-binding universal stress UspA family protein
MAAEGQLWSAIKGQRPGRAQEQEGGGAMTSESDGRELVVVGVDGSAESVRALGWAARYATATGARVQALLAWHYPAAAGQAPVGVAHDPVHKETEAQQLAILDEAIGKAYSGQPGQVAEARLGYGHPAQVLIDASREADLLVVGHRGHGAFTGMLLGSVSIHCVTGALCPVVVVRDSDNS